ncbi:MAG: hypothetical protein M3065_15590 [Actinomycetota bacterium]|nr:hypothetical protein [Actinomycetota bacterium]
MTMTTTLAEAITVPALTLRPATRAAAGLEQVDYAVLEPAARGIQVRAATTDEALSYEREHGLTKVTGSLEEFFAELDGE